jgi:V-type H+-transporting ATPase subunit C
MSITYHTILHRTSLLCIAHTFYHTALYVQAAETEVAQVHSTIGKWCKAHYGEVYSGWVHLKVIRGFIESVLRYGLPLDFLPVFIEPNMKREKQLKIALADAVSNLRPELKKQAADAEGEEGEEDDSENLPFVCQKFTVIGTAGSNESK